MSNPHVQHICNLTQAGDVLYISTTGYGIRDFLERVAALKIDGATIRRTNGQELVTFPNGNHLHLATRRTLHKVRGLTVHHVVTDDHTMLDDQQFRQTVKPCFNHPIAGKVERYTVIG